MRHRQPSGTLLAVMTVASAGLIRELRRSSSCLSVCFGILRSEMEHSAAATSLGPQQAPESCVAEPGHGPRPFAHLDMRLAPLYRSVMAVFTVAKQRFVVHLRPEDVAEALNRDGKGAPVTQEQVDEALRSLESWGNLRADPDTGRVTTVEDFYRARYLYQLTKEGEAAERALAVRGRAFQARGTSGRRPR
jgi:Protein of unknown function (DUF2397)